MSFFGKKFKKVQVENAQELLGALAVSEKILESLKNPDNVSSFAKNADGSIQYVIEANGKEILSQKIVLGQDVETTTPEGKTVHNVYTLDGDVLKSVMTANGKKTNFVRKFEGDSMTMEVAVEGSDAKAVVHYKTV
ncbi:uncharacterized protein LOC105386336 [Plutella xylostella]|uniref:uncharacterized protein LOC105386336 n=1 Tax=Plutella xylostella TaxID=51655 RepID=UPI002032BC5D|nr:uncharacterized protein LOC105386336 [Plutella xylostella]